jgi:hypothetical protein
MENVFRNQLVSKNQSLRGNALTSSLPRNGPYVTICLLYERLAKFGLPVRILWLRFVLVGKMCMKTGDRYCVMCSAYDVVVFDILHVHDSERPDRSPQCQLYH